MKKIRNNIAITLKIGNKSIINLTRNLNCHEKSKHIQTMFHYLRDKVNKEKLIVKYWLTQDQLVDLFSKTSVLKLEQTDWSDRLNWKSAK